MPGYGGAHGPDGTKKSGDQGGGTRDKKGGQTGGSKPNSGPKSKSMAETVQNVYDAPIGPTKTGVATGGSIYDGSGAPEGRQVYDSPIGPTLTGDPMGPTRTPSTNPLDKILGYDTVEDRVNAYNNNPSAPHQGYDSTIASFPSATPGYALGQFADALTGMLPGGGLATGAYRAGNFGLNGELDGPFTDMAESMGASRGPRGPDIAGGGFDRNGNGGENRSMDGSEYASDKNALPSSPMAEAMENMLEYTNGQTTPKKVQVPIKNQIPSPFPAGSASVVA